MNDTLLWTLLGHLVCIAQWAAFILVDYAYLGKNKKVRYPCIWAAVLAACVLFVSIRWNLGFFNTASIATNVVYLLLASLLFGGTPNQKLTGSLINGVMCLLTENTVSFLFAWFLGVPTGSVWRYKSCLAALVVSILAVGLLVAYFMRRWNSTCALEPLQAAVMSFFPGVVVALNMGLMVSANRQKPTLMNMVLTVGLTVAVLVHIAIVQMFNDQVVQRQSSRFRAQLEQQRAEALLDSYTAQRRLTHEFTNHMSALSALLNQGDMEGAHKGVTVYFDLCDLKRLPFDSTDMVIVISNLMDNAIRAAAEALPPEVHVRIRKTPDEYLISVCNRVQQNLEIEDGRLPATTKKESGHGMGLVNVQEILRKYGAEYTVSCRDCWFRFTCSLPVAHSTDNS